MKENLLEKNMQRHNIGLSKYATKDEDAIRMHPEQEDVRSPFFHDIDRIIYSYAYVRYSDKTQVFSKKYNDHITKRMLHVQYVSKIARTIGRALGLNEDLIEAASLGHDLGHVPYGHYGESVLNEISVKEQQGYFNHNIESVRLLMEIDNAGLGRNLTLQVLDAIMCHNGEFVMGEYYPKQKTKEEFLAEYQNTYQEKGVVKELVPMTLEGCVVRISDIIAYLGRDIEDACMLNLIKKEDIPENIREILGVKNREIVNTIIMDIIKNSLDKPYIKLSDDVFKAIVDLKKFNNIHIYEPSMTEEERKIVKEKFYKVYEHYLKDVQNENKDSKIYQNFLNFKKDIYFKNTTEERRVIDFIAGMTDDYFEECYKCTRNDK